MQRPVQSRTLPQLIDRQEGASYQNPMLFESPEGGEAGARVLTLTSRDEGKTWTKPEPLFKGPGAFTRHPVVPLADRTWQLPLTYVTRNGIGEGAQTNHSAMELSRDDGKSWRECPVPESEGKVQPTVVELSPHHLLALFRSRASDWIYRSEIHRRLHLDAAGSHRSAQQQCLGADGPAGRRAPCLGVR